jgi:hypothetical protein
MNKNAIIVYINDSDKALTEFSWLYKTWLMWSIDKSWDIVAFANPSIIEDFKSKFHHENLKVIEMLSSDTPIANPYAMFKDDNNIEMLKEYEFLFRTECDSFLTKHFADFKPWRDKVYVGIGLHAATTHPGDLIREKLKIISSTLGLKWYGHSHIGHNLLASSEMVIANSILQTGLTKWLLENSFTNGDGAYPSWFKGEVSQYAHELVINSNVSPLGIHQGSIDTWCGSNEITSLDLHIRAWPQSNDAFFDKVKYHAGNLPKIKFNEVPKTAGEYCVFVADTDIKEMLLLNKQNI